MKISFMLYPATNRQTVDFFVQRYIIIEFQAAMEVDYYRDKRALADIFNLHDKQLRSGGECTQIIRFRRRIDSLLGRWNLYSRLNSYRSTKS